MKAIPVVPNRLFTAIALLAASQAVMAQQDMDEAQSEALEHVVVRGAYFGQRAAEGAKTPTLLLDVPQSISVMTADQFADQAMTSVSEVLQYSPGVSLGQGEGHRDQMTLRGQNTTADFFVDDLRDDVQYFRPLYNLERVEILRGANALLFGRGGGGGVVNRVTKVADSTESFSELSAGIDSFGASLITLDSNLSVSNDQALRINAMVETLENHRDFSDGDRWAINPTYSLALGASTQITASWEHLDDDRIVDRGNPSENGSPSGGYRDTFFGDPDINNTTLNADIARLRIDHQLSNEWTLNATAQYADYDKQYQNLYPIAFDGKAETVSFDGYRDQTQRENAIVQLNIVGTPRWFGFEHTVLVGAEAGEQQSKNARQDALFALSADDQVTFGFSDPLVVPAVAFPETVRDRGSKVTFSSLFIQDELSLTEHWVVVAGARLDNFDIDTRDNISVANGDQDARLSSRDTEVSPRAGLIYKPSRDLSFYLSLSKSFLPRSGDQFLSLNASSAALAPEEFENQELGFKWNLTDDASVTAAVFEIERENGTAVDPQNPERSVLTGTRTRGLELEATGAVTDQWFLTASYTLLDGEEMGRFDGDTSANRELAQLPRHKLTLWSELQVATDWRIAGGVIYQSEQYASLSNAVALPGFTRVDAAAYWDVNERLGVQFNIENLFNEDYFPAAHNDNNISVGAPLNARVGLRYRF